MYIASTNLYLDLLKYKASVPANWITAEKYENCENFYQSLSQRHNRMKFFSRKNKS